MGDSVNCPQCGSENVVTNWCDECGAPLEQSDNRPEVDDVITAKNKDDQSFGASITYVDAQKGCTGDMPNLNAFPHYIKEKYGDVDGPDQTGLP